MHEIDDPISLSWEARRRNDIWAYGTLLSMIAQLESDKKQVRLFAVSESLHFSWDNGYDNT